MGVHRNDMKDAFLAVTDGDGVMLSEEHGGPRIVFPALFGWKSAKFLAEVEFLPELRPAGTSRCCPPRHRTHLNPRVLRYMASYDVASNVWQALGAGVLGEVGVPLAGAVGGGGAVGAGHQHRGVVRPPAAAVATSSSHSARAIPLYPYTLAASASLARPLVPFAAHRDSLLIV